MTLAPMTPAGYLPAGPHAATLDDIRERFVDQSPQPWDRGIAFDALQIHLGLLVDLAGHGTAWIGGGFCSHALDAPRQPLVVYWCQDDAHIERVALAPGALERLTLRGIAVSHPVASVAPVIRPMGGLVDAYLATPRMIDFYARALSRIPGDPSMMQGYLEVSL